MNTDISNVVQKFGLDGTDREGLIRAGKLVLPILDDVLEHFYDFAETDADTALFFPDESVLRHARQGQKHHWQLLLSGKFDQAYLDSASRIGSVHFRIQLPFLLYLSGYSHATSFIQSLLMKRSQSLFSKTSNAQVSRAIPILTRAFALDTHFVIEAYFAAQLAEQETAFRYLKAGMERMAKKDLSEEIPAPSESDFPERYEDIRCSFNSLLHSMRAVIETIHETTIGLKQKAEEVNASAENLSHRTETQAATLEQTAAAVEEINASVKASADATSQTNSMVLQTRDNAKEGDEVVQESINKMHEIATSSDRITKIINVIDDIAFQTNLLALNAGVEAARAGEAGRGFAVVASEVRGLAQRAADSAREINSLIASSTQVVESGVSLVERAGQSLKAIVSDVDKASGLSSQISSSAQEQATGLAEIATGVSHLDSVTQQNAAMVEETAAAVASMQQDTNVMARLVNEFVLDKKGQMQTEATNPFDTGWGAHGSVVSIAG